MAKRKQGLSGYFFKKLAEKVGRSYEVGGGVWELKRRKRLGKGKSPFYLYGSKYGSSVYPIDNHFALIDLIIDGEKHFYLFDYVCENFREIEAKDFEEAQRIAKNWSLFLHFEEILEREKQEPKPKRELGD